MFPLTPVVPNPPQLPYGAKYYFLLPVFSPLDPYWTPFGYLLEPWARVADAHCEHLHVRKGKVEPGLPQLQHNGHQPYIAKTGL
jgi:hypothetical protein